MNAFRSRNLHINLLDLSSRAISQRGVVFGAMIIGALLAFEVFNYSTTQFALGDVLGDLSFAGIRWATILAIAFCGIDFAGLARLFTPEQGADEPAEVWYLFGAWLLAAAMNATLTWWGVSVAIVNHSSLGSAVVSNSTIHTAVPIFVAVMVWIIRVLIIGTFSVAGERMFTQGEARSRRPQSQRTVHPGELVPASQLRRPVTNTTYRPAPKPAMRPESSYASRGEPTYTQVSYGARPVQTGSFVSAERHAASAKPAVQDADHDYENRYRD
jgi:hypothetical protein